LPDELQTLIAEVLAPDHFFAARPASLNCVYVKNEELPWELFRGRLLEPAQTRLRRSFAAWNIFFHGEGGTPTAETLSVKYDAPAGKLYVTRAFPCYAWEGYHAGDNVYLSRETVKWVRELVGSVDLARGPNPQELRAELADLVLRAVVGTSRLPLTSIEAPLPAFVLGQLGYFYRPGRAAGVMESWTDLIERGLYAEQSWFEKAKLLELVLRAVSPAVREDMIDRFTVRWQELGPTERAILKLLRTIFNEVSLSPYTHFVDNALGFVQALVERGSLHVTEQIDFLGALLRQLGRHLTAYDLVTFHHAGANYPDALLLDAALQPYLRLIENHPELFTADSAARRRRALRQAWILRRFYEGHAVPDAPTSPGENARVLPPPHLRVPEGQLAQPARRLRRLYAGDPLPRHVGSHARTVLRQSIEDLCCSEEMRELGMALFIDRPLGAFKAVGEPDLTLLFTHEAFSKTIAARRLAALERDPETGLGTDSAAQLRKCLDELHINGVAAEALAEPQRPVVSLADARRVSGDFIFLRTLQSGVIEFARQFDLTPLRSLDAELLEPQQHWFMARVVSERGERPAPLSVFDNALNKRLEMEVSAHRGYVTRAGSELPVAGLRVLRWWDKSGQAHDLSVAGIILLPRVTIQEAGR
jgi:hypothetical protein